MSIRREAGWQSQSGWPPEPCYTEADRNTVSSFNNLVGIKPTMSLTFRAVGRYDDVPDISHQDTVGQMTRNVASALIILSTITWRDDKDNYTQIASPRIPEYTPFLDVNAIKGRNLDAPRVVLTGDAINGNRPSTNIKFHNSAGRFQQTTGDLKSIQANTDTLEKTSEFNRVEKNLEQSQADETETIVVASKYPAVPKYPDLYEASITELQSGLDGCQFSSVDLVKAYLARIDEVNLKGPQLRAVIETNSRAIHEAAQLDKERKLGKKRSPLHGIPILLKDNIESEGMNTTAGSYALLGSIYPGDATVTAKLRKAGAIILGKANMSEWMSFRNATLAQGWSARGGQGTSPYYPSADPCGSSSGSAVAAAIGLATASLGTETVGSLICPASSNNVVGIKPTVGLTSRAGVIPISPHQDTIGPLARSVSDAAAILTVIAGRDNKDNYTQTAPKKTPDYTQFLNPAAIKGKRFGVPRGIFTNDAVTGNNPAINVEFEKALDIIRSSGGHVEDVDLLSIDSLSTLQGNLGIVLATDFKVAINKFLKSLKYIPTGVTSLAKLIKFNDANKNLEQPTGYEGQTIFLGAESTSGYNPTYYEALRQNLNLTREQGIDYVLKTNKLDALVLPSDGLIIIPAAIAGYPMINVPLGFLPNDTAVDSAGPNTVFPAPGLPFGLSFIGTAYSEPSLIGFAYAYEQRTQTRLKKRAYSKAIPSTQLKDVIH